MPLFFHMWRMMASNFLVGEEATVVTAERFPAVPAGLFHHHSNRRAYSLPGLPPRQTSL